ncbi:carboxy terminal-processing peptidase [Mucilaginibacter ginkgonis]|uniref:Carboxy terminal-processing peptidase n=1 Tax=Mucilaginibacter ginkgonis TaxID=2682091 RepID=A0A6I4I215_9SPHI|nr:carboxy terminal-processing peptidase [Mucilaginibacter ginkgonis]QQL49340.1 carboxy terminal-processing peptidase [Mucilaginibacter ginkgonis]
MFKRFYMLVVLGAALACNAAPSQKVPVTTPGDLQPDAQQSVVLKEVASLISRYNYKKVPLDDSLSKIIYNRYLKSLDENHNYLLASDVKQFETYKLKLDDDIQEGNLNDVFQMFNVYKKRYNDRIKYSLSQLNNKFDFNQNEDFVYDRDSLPFVASEADMNVLWTKRVKYDLLNLRLASADEAKNKETLKKRYENLISQFNKLNNQDVFQFFMDAVTNSIDPHTTYFNPANAAQFNIEMSKTLEGIGATLASENDYVTIKSIVPGGPADKSKQIYVDDRIVAVAQGANGEFQDIIGWRVDNAITLIRGAKGTLVRLKLLSKGKSLADKPHVVELVREKIVVQDQSVKKEIKTYNENGRTYKIGIINVPAFYIDFAAYKAGDPNYKSTTRDVKLILDTLKRQNVDGVVMDLRQNGGGSLVEAIDLSGLFIKTGPVVQVRDVKNKIEVDQDEDPAIAWTGPMAVLTDRFSASASEIFAGAMQDYGRALIIGTQTYGKGTVQSVIDLDQVISPSVSDMIARVTNKQKVAGSQSKFGQLNLTMAKFYRISGGSTQHKGVTPDISFPAIIPLDKYGEDTEPSALPYDMIQPSPYSKVGDFSAVLPTLKQMHNSRMANNVSYKYLLEDIADFKKRDAEKSITLNEQQLKQKRDADEARSLEHDNQRRVAMGLQPLKKGAPRPKNEDLDFLKYEAGQIVTDYASMGNKMTAAPTKVDP